MTEAISVALEFRKLDKWSRRKLRQNMTNSMKHVVMPGYARLIFDRLAAAGEIRVIKTVEEKNSHD
jgi:hypothetical protein